MFQNSAKADRPRVAASRGRASPIDPCESAEASADGGTHLWTACRTEDDRVPSRTWLFRYNARAGRQNAQLETN